ncbi:DUF1542 domain-containing protein, partial [Staphylococcus capitis]|uniref:DUF1542 domain-containing protein n=1 Tax=Staphylococcus capitis TaxID=29388 RepID=UPI0011A59659
EENRVIDNRSNGSDEEKEEGKNRVKREENRGNENIDQGERNEEVIDGKSSSIDRIKSIMSNVRKKPTGNREIDGKFEQVKEG